jgi:hypothetical protein
VDRAVEDFFCVIGMPDAPEELRTLAWRAYVVDAGFATQHPPFTPPSDCSGDEMELRQILSVAEGSPLFSGLDRKRGLTSQDAPSSLERLQPGQTVRIKQGALAGLECTVIEQRRAARLLIAPTYLRGISIQIDDLMVEPAKRLL